MSSELSEKERQKMPERGELKQQLYAQKRSTFVRSSSLERIRRFNTYICSQNYFVLPAILIWLRTSQNNFQCNLERSILFMKSLVFNCFVYKQAQEKFWILAALSLRSYRKNVRPGLETIFNLLCDSLNHLYSQISRALFITTVYLTVLLIFLQLLVCLYMLSLAFIPIGLVFMIICLYSIAHLNFKCLSYFSNQTEKMPTVCQKIKFNPPVRLSRKDILGRRTISSLKLL